MVDPTYGYDLKPVPWQAPRLVSAETRAAARAALAADYYRPATMSEMERELAALALRCRTSEGDGEQFRMRVALYAADLRAVPFWLLRKAAAEHAKASRWFPAVAELLEAARKLDPDTLEQTERLLAIASAAVAAERP